MLWHAGLLSPFEEPPVHPSAPSSKLRCSCQPKGPTSVMRTRNLPMAPSPSGGSGVLIQRFFGNDSVAFEEAAGGTSGGTLTCRCPEGSTGDCSITITDSIAKCTGDTCCAWIIGSHGAPPPDKVLWGFG
jgi:hypothetical protein